MMTQGMIHVFEIIKIVTVIQIVLTGLLLFSAYGLRVYVYFKTKRKRRWKHWIQTTLRNQIRCGKFDAKVLETYKKHQGILLPFIHHFDQRKQNSDEWAVIRNTLMDSVILPNARHFARSKRWINRRLACHSFQLILEEQDIPLLQLLIADPMYIISIQAALIAVHYDSQSLIDTVIDVFSQGRHIQQSLFAQFVSSDNPHFPELVHDRLKREQNPYIKVFCYRLLSHPGLKMEPVSEVFMDVESDNLELRIGAMVYLFIHDPRQSSEICLAYLQDKHWQVRAKAASLLGATKNLEFAKALETCLHDEVWWVRVNAAEGLARMGSTGKAILKQQNQQDDPFAQETSSVVLSKITGEKHG